MKQRTLLLGCGLGLLIGWLVIFGLPAQPALAKSYFQDSSCDELLTRILARAGWKQINQPHNSCEYLGASSSFYATAGLSIDPGDGSPFVIHSCSENTVPPCTETTFHGYPAITAVSNGTGSIGWSMPRGNTEYRFYVFMGEGYDVMQFAEELVAAAEQELPAGGLSLPEPSELATEEVPAEELPPDVVTPEDFPSNSDCSGVTVDELRNGGLTVLKCRLQCDPDSMSDAELQVCIDQFSGQTDAGNTPQNPDGSTSPENNPDGETLPPSDSIPDEEILPPLQEPAVSNPSKQLGPLATTPWVPLAGGLIGTAAGWLISLAVSSANVLKPIVPMPRPSSFPPARPADPRITAPPARQAPLPPPVQTSSPPVSTDPLPAQAKTTAAAPTGKAEGPLELGFNLVKDTVGAISNVGGVFNKYFGGPDTAETVNAMRDAVKTWHVTPSLQSAANYLEKLRNSNALREPEICKKLGVVGKGLDVIDALNNARKICEKRGYSGWDALLTTYAKVGQKAVVWGLTKNPLVSLADAAFGGFTQLTLGADKRIDIGAVVDKSAEVWDQVTKHAADRYYRGIEKNADAARMENLKYLSERIRQQVVDGKISPQEGSRRLQHVIDKTNQESPLL